MPEEYFARQRSAKLLTPFNTGAFDLRHRIVVDWGTSVANILPFAGRDRFRIPYPKLTGGLVIHDPGPLIWPVFRTRVSVRSDHLLKAWKSTIEGTKAADQTVVARLSTSGSSHVPANFDGVEMLNEVDVDRIIRSYVDAATRAREAGFDGIELDGSRGSVTDLFLLAAAKVGPGQCDETAGQRVNFILELVNALSRIYGKDRIGVRLSPFLRSDVQLEYGDVFDEAVRTLHDLEIAYIHLVDAMPSQSQRAKALYLSPAAETLRRAYPGAIFASGRPSLRFGLDLVECRWADAVCYNGETVDDSFMAEVIVTLPIVQDRCSSDGRI